MRHCNRCAKRSHICHTIQIHKQIAKITAAKGGIPTKATQATCICRKRAQGPAGFSREHVGVYKKQLAS